MRLFVFCLLTNGLLVCAQNVMYFSTAGPPPDGTNITVKTASGFGGSGVGLVINGQDVGTILLKACDTNQDGQVSLAELTTAADAYFKQWDTNSDGSLGADELAAGLKNLFPPPPTGAQGMAMVNGVAVQVSADEMPTPDGQLTKQIMAQADANQDAVLSAQELNDWLNKNFSQWDQNGDGLLDVSELNAVFGQLARPDFNGN